MENLKELVRENLIKLRKANKFTQLELAQQIGYSDKAVSRWETGEVTPDIETLNSLSELYGVPLTAFFEKLDKNSAKKKRFKNLQIGNKMAIALLSIVCIWAIATVIFATILSSGNGRAWMSFVWALPVSFVVAIVFNALWGRRGWTFVFVSLLVWSLILSVYLQLLSYNMFLLFIVGVPLQVCVILSSCIHSKKE